MLLQEEQQVLRYLCHHSTCTFGQIVHACLRGAPEKSAHRILQNLEWFGYVIVFPGVDGAPEAVQITARGKDLI